MARQDLKIGIAQLNLLVGDIEGNAERIITSALQARDQLRADLVVFSELTLTAYPPEDLILRPGLIRRVDAALETIANKVHGIDLILGLPSHEQSHLYNSAFVLRDGNIEARYHKHILPNYEVFDEKRYFSPGEQPCVFDLQGVQVGITVCEDIWQPVPARLAAQAGAHLLININASPFHL